MTIIGRDKQKTVRRCNWESHPVVECCAPLPYRNCVHFKFTSLRFRSRTRSIEHTNKQSRRPAYANDWNRSFCLLGYLRFIHLHDPDNITYVWEDGGGVIGRGRVYVYFDWYANFPALSAEWALWQIATKHTYVRYVERKSLKWLA